MLKKKICTLLATLMVATSVLGAMPSIVKADTLTTLSVEGQAELKSGIYSVKNTTEYAGENNATGEEMARKVLSEDSKIKVENGKVYLTLTFEKSMYSFLNNISASIDGEKLNVESNTAERTITMEVPSIESKVKVDVTVSLMGREVSFYVTNNIDTLTLVEAFEEENTGSTALEDGKYKVTNNTRYTTDSEHGNTSARNAIEKETLITVENGKTFMTVTFSQMYSMLENITATVDGVNLELTHNQSERTITFEVPSADTEVLLGMNIKGMNHQVEFYFTNDMTTIEKVTGEVDTPAEDDKEEVIPEVKPEVKPEQKPEVDNNTNNGGSASEETAGKKVYTIENEVYHESAIGMSMARQYLNSTSKVEEVDGQFFVTLTFTGVEYMNSHQIFVNGTKVNSEVVESTDSKLSLKFAVGDLTDSIKVDTFVIPMGRNIQFNVNLLKDTLTLVSGNEDIKEENTNTSTGNNSSTPSTNNGTSSSTNTKVEEESNVKETVTVKIYNVQNNVTHENATGAAMARKYLNSLTEVKEINGKYYVTLTFTGVDLMQNHQIYVNGVPVSHTVVASTSDSKSIRFVVSSLEDAISVKTYVVPMSREVEFKVELLLDTLTLVDEYTVEADKLPETGAATSSAATLSMALTAIASGAVLRRKRK